MRKTHQISEIREGIKITKVYEFGDSVQIGNVKGIVIKRVKKRKYLYYFIVMEDTGLHANDWNDNLLEYIIRRQDKL